jgi:hypothetical protein
VFSGPFSHLPLSSFLLSRQIQHSLSTAAVTVEAAVVVPMVAAVEAAAVVPMVEAEAFTVADLTAAGGLLVEEEVTTKAAAFVVGQGRVLADRAAGLTADLKRAAVFAQKEIEHRMFVRQSKTASGIRSATPAVPRA